MRTIEAELTWTGERFERGVRVTVADDGRIASVGPAEGGGAELPNRALLPGFVNAHSHAFQRGLRGRGERFPTAPTGPAGTVGLGSFWSWREAMYSLVGALGRDGFRALTLAAFREMRSVGITTVGEFHYFHHADPEGAPDGAADFGLDELVLEAAAEAGVRLVLLQTCYREGGPGRPLEPAQRRFRSDSVPAFVESLDRLAERAAAFERCSLGIVAHSIRAVPPDDVAALWEEAVRRDLPFHMHVEEQVREIVECAAAYGARPMELLLDRLEIGPGTGQRFTAVHCTHTDPADMARFAAAGGNVCICPTTEANLGDGIADLPGVLAAGGAVCLGTDSNARISMLEEARWLELVQRLALERRGVLRDERGGEHRSGRVATTLLDAATRHGARALGVDAGAIRPGAWADLVAFDLGHPEISGWDDETLLESIFLGASDRAIAGTFVGGDWRGMSAAAY